MVPVDFNKYASVLRDPACAGPLQIFREQESVACCGQSLIDETLCLFKLFSIVSRRQQITRYSCI
jgi:hypothetical protein